ncbi:hypothetical protein [Pseudomonas aeruginosa]
MRLNLPNTFEDVRSALQSAGIDQRLVEFVKPIEKAEKIILKIKQEIEHSGKVLFLLAPPGAGEINFYPIPKLATTYKVSRPYRD